jgi:hypothetical protein
MNVYLQKTIEYKRTLYNLNCYFDDKERKSPPLHVKEGK